MSCPTRQLSGPLFWDNSLCRALLVMLNHFVVYLVPSYKSVLNRKKAERRLFPAWMEESALCLQDCFSHADLNINLDVDLDVFKNACVDLNKLTETVSAYISFCEETIIPRKVISFCSNIK